MTTDSEFIAEDTPALLDRLQVIAAQPLSERADSFGQLHQELSRILEATDH